MPTTTDTRAGRQVHVASGFIRDGLLFLAKHSAFDAVLAAMPNGQVVIRVEQVQDARSVALNAYYWAVVIEMVSTETGYTDKEAHAEMKQLHLPIRFAALRGNGKIKDVRVFEGTTTDLSNAEEWEYIENIKRWAAETLDLVIPDPELV